MAHISKHQLDGELRSQLSFEFVPIHEGGILSGVTAATPTEDGALLAAGSDSSIYVKFKTTPYFVFTADVWFYFSYFTTGTSVLDMDFDIYYQVFPEGQTPSTPVGPVTATIAPDGTDKLQTTITVINNSVFAWRVPAGIKKNSFVRFEIVRKGSTDANPDDLRILDVNYATIPTYLTLANYDDGLPQALIPLPTGTSILNNRGELLSNDGAADITVPPPPGAGTHILSFTDTGPSGIEWLSASSLVSTTEVYSGTLITADKVFVAADRDFIYKVENTSGSNIDLELPEISTLANGAFFVYQLTPSNVDTVTIQPNALDTLNDLTTGAVASIALTTIGETIKIITDGAEWYVYNTYEEASVSGTGTESTEEFEVGVSAGVVAGAATVVTASVDTLTPRYYYLNGLLVQNSFFSVGGVGNREFTWTGSYNTVNGDIIKIVFYT